MRNGPLLFSYLYRFRSCLKQANTAAANMVGKLFFNIIQTKCFILKPEKVCKKTSWWGKCEKSEWRKKAYLRDPIPYWKTPFSTSILWQDDDCNEFGGIHIRHRVRVGKNTKTLFIIKQGFVLAKPVTFDFVFLHSCMLCFVLLRIDMCLGSLKEMNLY